MFFISLGFTLSGQICKISRSKSLKNHFAAFEPDKYFKKPERFIKCDNKVQHMLRKK